MAKVLTKKEAELLEEISKRKGVRGKKEIEHFIWMNTTEPKYKVGTAVKVTDKLLSICGERVIDWNGKITKVNVWRIESRYQYEVEITYKVNGVEKKSMVCCWENEIRLSNSTDSGKEFKYDGKYYETLDVII